MSRTGGRSRRRRSIFALGLVAGLAGTAVLSIFESLERRLLGREPVYAPARLVARLAARAGIAIGASRARRLGRAMRWVYGPSLGIASAWLSSPSGPRPGRVLRRAAAILGFELVALPLVGAVPPLAAWPSVELLLLAAHTSAFAAGAELAFPPAAGWRTPNPSTL
ncbi:MAG TPA: hypothetical protein VFG23_15595 [Polyangia bacterium]|nr:hypothetical protein [Polyangia bacterium]